jgi:hypothetical protein
MNDSCSAALRSTNCAELLSTMHSINQHMMAEFDAGSMNVKAPVSAISMRTDDAGLVRFR